MTDTPPKPNRRRWRWLAGVMILFVASVGWWNWPRADRRFVGRWRLSDEAPGLWHLKSNGTAAFEELSGGKTTMRTSWQVKGDRLQIGRSMLEPPSPFRQWFVKFWNSNTPWFWTEYGTVYKILRLDGNELHCAEGVYEGGEMFADAVAEGTHYIFNRVPE